MWLKDEENYEDWLDNITVLLGSRGLIRYIRNDIKATPLSRPSTLTPEQQAEFDSLEMNCITCSMAI